MGLNIYLTLKSVQQLPYGRTILIRENGQIKELSRAEWDERFPNREPVTVNLPGNDDEEVHWANITHNLRQMAKAAGIYFHLWRPEEINITQAFQLSTPLTLALAAMRDNPEWYRQFDAENGRGTYVQFLLWLDKLLEACNRWPAASISVNR